MKENSFTIGQLVCSKCGRDRGNFYLVFEIINDSFVYLVDGFKRRMENPKRKNVKHLRGFPAVAEHLAVQWEAGQQVANSEVRRVIACLKKAHADKDSETRG
ncbi:MAG TPA: RNA-binding protein [Syntrophomonadaceae bacterium]|nr:RNA-binding protein [Syntrophomonadaceae bacterium]